jgi:TM2 domain-containing membrane protein YozV
MKNKTTAALLAIFLGWAGGHKFYLGRPVVGLIYIFLGFGVISGILGFIEGLIYLTMSDNAFDAKYNNQNQNFVNSPLNSGVSNADELEKLYNLKEKGILTEEEFQAKKSKLIR